MVKAYAFPTISGRQHRCCRILHGGLQLQDAFHPGGAGHGLGHGNDQVGQLDQLHQDLVQIVDQSDHLAGLKRTFVDLHSAAFQQNDQRRIDQNKGQRIHQRGQTSDSKLHPGQFVVVAFVDGGLFFLHAEGAKHANASHVFPGVQQHLVQLALHFLVSGKSQSGNAHHRQRQKRKQRQKNQSGAGVNGKGHDGRAKDHEGGTQQQTQHHVHARLHLIHVRGHAVDQRRSTKPVQIRIGKTLNMGKERGLHIGGKAGGRPRSKILRRGGRSKSQQAKADQNQSGAEYIAVVGGHNALVDDRRHQQWDKKLQQRFQQFEQRSQYALLPVGLQKGKQGFHGFVSFSIGIAI